MSTPKGFPSQKKDERVGAQHVTVEPVGQSQYGLTVSGPGYHVLTASDAVEAGSTTSVIVATAHSALRGDIIRFTSGAHNNREVKVHSIPSANSIELVETLATAPVVAVTFDILRAKAAVINADGSLITTSAAGDLSYKRNAVSTFVSEDTGTPANSRPLPVKLMGVAGDINITAGDLNVSLDHANDSTKIGDGVDLLAITAAGEALVSLTTPLPAGTNNIGDVDVLSLPALPAGANTIGKVDQGLGGASAWKVDGSAVTQPVSGPLTDAQLRAAAVPVSGAFFQATQPVSGPLTDAELRAAAVPVSAAALPLPTGASTSALQTTGNTSLSSIDGKVPANLTVTATRLLVDGSGVTQPVSIAGTVSVTEAALDIIDFLDTPLHDSAVTTIPGSASTPVTVVASLAAAVKKIQSMDTTGSYIGLYSDPAGTPVLQAIIGPGSDTVVDVAIPAATVLGVRSMTTSSITVGNLAINFIG